MEKFYIEESWARKLRTGKNRCGFLMQLYFEIRRRWALWEWIKLNQREFREGLNYRDKNLTNETNMCKRGYILVSLEKRGNEYSWNSRDKVVICI